jgi:hypothetical protein
MILFCSFAEVYNLILDDNLKVLLQTADLTDLCIPNMIIKKYNTKVAYWGMETGRKYPGKHCFEEWAAVSAAAHGNS